MDYEIEDEPVGRAIVHATSTVVDEEPSSLPPLADVVDPDALDVLFSPQNGDEDDTGVAFSFVYANCRVTVKNGESLTIHSLQRQCSAENGQSSSHGE